MSHTRSGRHTARTKFRAQWPSLTSTDAEKALRGAFSRDEFAVVRVNIAGQQAQAGSASSRGCARRADSDHGTNRCPHRDVRGPRVRLETKRSSRCTEEFPELIIPKVWQREGRKLSRVAARPFVSPKKIRAVVGCVGAEEATDGMTNG